MLSHIRSVSKPSWPHSALWMVSPIYQTRVDLSCSRNVTVAWPGVQPWRYVPATMIIIFGLPQQRLLLMFRDQIYQMSEPRHPSCPTFSIEWRHVCLPFNSTSKQILVSFRYSLANSSSKLVVYSLPRFEWNIYGVPHLLMIISWKVSFILTTFACFNGATNIHCVNRSWYIANDSLPFLLHRNGLITSVATTAHGSWFSPWPIKPFGPVWLDFVDRQVSHLLKNLLISLNILG